MEKSRKWIKGAAGVAAVAVAGFLVLGFIGSNQYEVEVKKLLREPHTATFQGVRRYSSGSTCGLVTSSQGEQRFIVGPNGKAALDDGTSAGSQVFTMTMATICR